MRIVKRAALAPLRPSARDYAVHARASRTESQARVELRQDRMEASEQAREKSAPEATDDAPEQTLEPEAALA